MGVNKVIYGDETLIDLTSDSVTADTLAEGVTAHDKSGKKIVGTLSVPKVVSITIANPPTKTEYVPGEYFDPAGMVIHVNYSNGIVGITRDYSYTPTAALTTNNTAVTISYTEGGVTVTATQSIKVEVSLDPTFANNSWSTIIYACKNKIVPSSWVVGNSKPMTINGKSYQIDIIGKNHDAYNYAMTDMAPLTFQMHDCYDTTYEMNSSNTNKGGFTSSIMKTSHLPTIKSQMPSEVQSAIKSVYKLTSLGNKSTSVNRVAYELFLLSAVEVHYNTSYFETKFSVGEGSLYEYYNAGNGRVKYLNGTAQGWWLRSPCMQHTTDFAVLGSSGGLSDPAATVKYGVAFAFCF